MVTLTKDFKTNIEPLRMSLISDVINTGNIIRESMCRGGEGPAIFGDPTYIFTLYMYNEKIYWVEKISKGICEDCYRGFYILDIPTLAIPENIYLMWNESKEEPQGYYTSKQLATEYYQASLTDRNSDSFTIFPIECIDDSQYIPKTIYYQSTVYYTFDDNKWYHTTPQHCHRTSDLTFTTFSLDIDDDEDCFIITMLVPSTSNNIEDILKIADEQMTLFFDMYPSFRDGTCNLKNVRDYNNYLKDKFVSDEEK